MDTRYVSYKDWYCVLEIIINSSSCLRLKKEKQAPTTSKHFPNVANRSNFAVQGSPERKKEKTLRGSGEITKKKKDWKKNGGQMKREGSYI